MKLPMKSLYYWRRILKGTIPRAGSVQKRLQSELKMVSCQISFLHIVTVARKCLVSRDDKRQFWSRPDQKHDNSGRDANCISRC